MKRIPSIVLSFTVATLMVAAPHLLSAQSQKTAAERSQIKRNIEIVEGVINTVRQQALNAASASMMKANDPNNPISLYLRSSEGNRTEGIYLEGYGVIFEVGIPNFVEQRSVSFALGNIFSSPSDKRMGRVSVSQTPSRAASEMILETSVAGSPATLETLSKLIDNYTQELQRLDKQAALRDLLAKLREKDFLGRANLFGPEMTQAAAAEGKAKATSPPWNPEQQRQQLQDAIVKAVADYGSTIPGLQPHEFVTILMKAPVGRDFSLFTPETRTSTIIRFSVRDLQDYRLGKISFEDLKSRTKIEEN